MSQELPSPDVMIDLIKVSKVYPPDVQALTDDFIKRIDELLALKEKEIMEV